MKTVSAVATIAAVLLVDPPETNHIATANTTVKPMRYPTRPFEILIYGHPNIWNMHAQAEAAIAPYAPTIAPCAIAAPNP